MSTKNDNRAYFTDGHTEVITQFEISKDWHSIWFTTESGRSFVYQEVLVHTESNSCYQDYKFYEVKFDRDYDEYRYLVTDDIEKIVVCTMD